MNKLRSISYLPIIIILVAAFFLRVYKINEYMTFLGDEGRDVIIVRNLLTKFDIPFIGPTASVGGFYLGPIYYYLMAPFLLIWNYDPTGPAIMVAIFGTITVLMIYKLLTKYVSPIAGLIASSLYAVSPIVIAYSRSSWNPNLVPFTIMVLLYILLNIGLNSSLYRFFFIGLILGFGLQFHYLFSFVIIFSFIFLLITKTKISAFQKILISILGILISEIPLILFELKNGFPNSNALFSFLRSGKDTGFEITSYFSIVYETLLKLFGRLLFRMPEYKVWLGLYGLNRAVWEIPILFCVIISLYKLCEIIFIQNNKKNSVVHIRFYKILILWFVVSLSLFGLYKKEIYDYYLGILFPFPFIAIGILLWHLGKNSYGNFISLIVWAILLLWNIMGNPFQYPPNNQLKQMKAIADEVLTMADKKPFNFALVTNSNSDHAFRYFFEVDGNKPVTIENKQKDPDRKSVTDQLIVICDIECHVLGNSLWEIAGFGRAQIEKVHDVPFVKVYRLIHYN